MRTDSISHSHRAICMKNILQARLFGYYSHCRRLNTHLLQWLHTVFALAIIGNASHVSYNIAYQRQLQLLKIAPAEISLKVGELVHLETILVNFETIIAIVAAELFKETSYSLVLVLSQAVHFLHCDVFASLLKTFPVTIYFLLLSSSSTA